MFGLGCLREEGRLACTDKAGNERILGRRKTPDARLLHRTEFETEAPPSLVTRPPAKMGVAFSSMLTACPADVSTRIGADFQKRYKISHTCLLCMNLCPQIMAYGGCVQRQLGSLEKGSCEKRVQCTASVLHKGGKIEPPSLLVPVVEFWSSLLSIDRFTAAMRSPRGRHKLLWPQVVRHLAFLICARKHQHGPSIYPDSLSTDHLRARASRTRPGLY